MPILGKDLRLPKSPESVAFRTIVGIVAADPVLKPVVKTLWFWSGEMNDTQIPTVDHCPFIRMTPTSSPMGWEAESLHMEPMQIAVELGVAGTDVTQLMDLWHAFAKALFPTDLTQRDAVREKVTRSLIIHGELTQHGYGVKTDPESSMPLLLGQGVLECKLHIPT